DGKRAVLQQVIPATENGDSVKPLDCSLVSVRMLPEQIRQSRLPVGKEQIVRLAFEIAESLYQALTELIVFDDGIFCKWQRVKSGRHLHGCFRRKIEHTVAQTFVGAGTTIVNVVRMQHDNLPGRAEMRCATIGKGLDAGKRHTERIGVM